MDKTVEIIVVAMVALAAAMILIFMVRGQSSGFLDFANSQASNAECSVIDSSGQDVPPECVDSGGDGGSVNSGPDCGTIGSQASCSRTGVCTWAGGQCVSKR